MAFATDSRRSGSTISAVIAAASRACSGDASAGGAGGGSGVVSGSGPGVKRSLGRPGRRSEISAARWVSSKPQIASRTWTTSVPSGCVRAGQALRAISSPTAAGHAVTASPAPAVGADAAQLAPRIWSPSGSIYAAASSTLPGVTSSSWSGSAGSIAASVAVTSACPALRTRAARIRRRSGIELREDVVEQEQRRDARPVGDRLGLGEEQGEQGEPLLSLRAEAAQIAVAGGDHDVVEVRARARSRRARDRARARRRAPPASAARRRTGATPLRGRTRRREPRTAARAARESRRAPRRAPLRAAATRSLHGSTASRVE